jgi:hypothetical protein
MDVTGAAQHRRRSDTSSFLKNKEAEQIIDEKTGHSSSLHPSQAEKLSR